MELRRAQHDDRDVIQAGRKRSQPGVRPAWAQLRHFLSHLRSTSALVLASSLTCFAGR